MKKARRKITKSAETATAVIDSSRRQAAPTPKEDSMRTILARMREIIGGDELELFRIGDTACVSYRDDDTTTSEPVSGKKFRAFVVRKCIDCGLGTDAQVRELLRALEAEALGKPDHELALRIAHDQFGIFVDRGDEKLGAIQIDEDGWGDCKECATKFRRAHGLLPLAAPERDGSLEAFAKLFKLTDEQCILIAAWLIGLLSPHRAYPILQITGPNDSGKSTLARMLKSLIDPSRRETFPDPTNQATIEKDAEDQFVLLYNNIARFSSKVSNALCRISDGSLGDLARPVIIAAIDAPSFAPDFLDRVINVELQRIADEDRKAENEVWAEFEQIRGHILGALFDAAVAAIKNLDSVTFDRAPRFASFAKWVIAAEPATFWGAGEFLKAYLANRRDQHEVVAEDHPVVAALIDFVKRDFEEWEGTATELLAALEENVPRARRGTFWPCSPNALSRAIMEHVSSLSECNVEAVRMREPGGNRQRVIRLRWTGEVAKEDDAPVAEVVQHENDHDSEGSSATA